jgi:DNA-binding response OmpR family regulator
LELARRIRQDPALNTTPILIVTSQEATVSADDRAADFDDYIVKPWSPQDLREKVEGLIRRQAP